MSMRTVSKVRIATAAAALMLATNATAGSSLEALDYAFRFASAITSDARDRAKAQELALAAYATAGAYDEASRRAGQIEGWRRGMVYAGLATELARAGRAVEAREYVRRAESVRAETGGWENPRISAQVAEALALLGDRENASRITADLAAADPIQYAGRAVAVEAVATAAHGDFTAAMDRLRSLEQNDDLDTAWSRTVGYLALARRTDAPKADRLRALGAARASADRLPFERRLDGLLQIAPEYRDLGKKGDARKAVAAAARLVGNVATSEAIPGLIAVGQAWGEIAEPEKGREVLLHAEGRVAQALSIDQPGLLARIASGYRRLPDPDSARRLDLAAVDHAAGMLPSRPRALALSAICRQMGQDGVMPDAAFRARLDNLLAGLGDPW